MVFTKILSYDLKLASSHKWPKLMRSIITNKITFKGGMCMTQNQIAYWNYVEGKRHNLATETETNRNNVATLAETNRANLAKEKQNRINSDRSYYMSLVSFEEQKRATRVSEDLRQKELNETIRSNKAREEISRTQAANQSAQVAVQRRAQAETERSNKARETLTSESQRETKRSNIASQGLKATELKETTRSHKANESNQRFANTLTAQKNQIQQSYNNASLKMTKKQLDEVERHNRVNEQESIRHNKSSELISLAGSLINYAAAKRRAEASEFGSVVSSGLRLITPFKIGGTQNG